MRFSGVGETICLSVPRRNSRLDGSSYDIDQRVKAILQEGLSVYRVDAEQVACTTAHL